MVSTLGNNTWEWNGEETKVEFCAFSMLLVLKDLIGQSLMASQKFQNISKVSEKTKTLGIGLKLEKICCLKVLN